MNKAQQLVLLKELLKRKARKSFKHFIKWMDGRKMPWHIELMADEFENVVSGNQKKLCVSIPPGHAKSFTCNYFVAWTLGVNPNCRVIMTSYSDRLVRRNCQAIQDIMRDPLYAQVFPGTRIDTNQTLTSKEFHIAGNVGYVIAEAAGGQITGFRADLLIVDDPYKGMAAAKSEVNSEGIKEWYDATFRSRGHDMTGEIVIHTRWQPEDLIGWLLGREGNAWRSVVLTALKEGVKTEHQSDSRAIGDALWPEMISQSSLEERRSQNPFVFSSLYQQNPTIAEGELLKIAWCKNHWNELPEPMDRWIQSWDLRNGGKSSSSSYAVGQLWAQKGPNAYLIDQVRGRWDFPETLKVMEEQLGNPLWSMANTVLIEDKADGRAAIPILKQKFAGIIPVSPRSSKEERLSATTSYWAAGNVLLPKKPWLPEFIDELTKFPLSNNDDQVDACTQALEWLYNKPQFAFVI
jgi:predicted phage terminase large subunit-like protein